jgi:O-acetyl-ADP-ribose deacetylase
MVEKKVGDKVIRLVVGDVTDIEVQAFVFDITEDAKLGSGYGGAITGRAGKIVQDALDEIGKVVTGDAVITTAGKMKAEHIIHTNGPKFHEPDTEGKLSKAMASVLDVAEANDIKTLALPPIGTGMYQVPLDLCARVMVGAVDKHLKGNSKLEEVVFVALNSREYAPLEAAIQGGA